MNLEIPVKNKIAKDISNPTEHITEDELKLMLVESFKGSEFVSLVMQTSYDKKMYKRNNPFYSKIIKYQKLKVNFGFNYQNAINGRRKREGKPDDFQAAKRTWGRKIKGTPFIEHKNMFYLECNVLETLESTLINIDDVDMSEDEIKKAIAPFLKSKSVGKSKQGLDNELIYRAIRFDHIAQFKMRGKSYWVTKTN